MRQSFQFFFLVIWLFFKNEIIRAFSRLSFFARARTAPLFATTPPPLSPEPSGLIESLLSAAGGGKGAATVGSSLLTYAPLMLLPLAALIVSQQASQKRQEVEKKLDAAKVDVEQWQKELKQAERAKTTSSASAAVTAALSVAILLGAVDPSSLVSSDKPGDVGSLANKQDQSSVLSTSVDKPRALPSVPASKESDSPPSSPNDHGEPKSNKADYNSMAERPKHTADKLENNPNQRSSLDSLMAKLTLQKPEKSSTKSSSTLFGRPFEASSLSLSSNPRDDSTYGSLLAKLQSKELEAEAKPLSADDSVKPPEEKGLGEMPGDDVSSAGRMATLERITTHTITANAEETTRKVTAVADEGDKKKSLVSSGANVGTTDTSVAAASGAEATSTVVTPDMEQIVVPGAPEPKVESTGTTAPGKKIPEVVVELAKASKSEVDVATTTADKISESTATESKSKAGDGEAERKFLVTTENKVERSTTQLASVAPTKDTVLTEKKADTPPAATEKKADFPAQLTLAEPAKKSAVVTEKKVDEVSSAPVEKKGKLAAPQLAVAESTEKTDIVVNDKKVDAATSAAVETKVNPATAQPAAIEPGKKADVLVAGKKVDAAPHAEVEKKGEPATAQLITVEPAIKENIVATEMPVDVAVPAVAEKKGGSTTVQVAVEEPSREADTVVNEMDAATSAASEKKNADLMPPAAEKKSGLVFPSPHDSKTAKAFLESLMAGLGNHGNHGGNAAPVGTDSEVAPARKDDQVLSPNSELTAETKVEEKTAASPKLATAEPKSTSSEVPASTVIAKADDPKEDRSVELEKKTDAVKSQAMAEKDEKAAKPAELEKRSDAVSDQATAEKDEKAAKSTDAVSGQATAEKDEKAAKPAELEKKNEAVSSQATAEKDEKAAKSADAVSGQATAEKDEKAAKPAELEKKNEAVSSQATAEKDEKAAKPAEKEKKSDAVKSQAMAEKDEKAAKPAEKEKKNEAVSGQATAEKDEKAVKPAEKEKKNEAVSGQATAEKDEKAAKPAEKEKKSDAVSGPAMAEKDEKAAKPAEKEKKNVAVSSQAMAEKDEKAAEKSDVDVASKTDQGHATSVTGTTAPLPSAGTPILQDKKDELAPVTTPHSISPMFDNTGDRPNLSFFHTLKAKLMPQDEGTKEEEQTKTKTQPPEGLSSPSPETGGTPLTTTHLQKEKAQADKNDEMALAATASPPPSPIETSLETPAPDGKSSMGLAKAGDQAIPFSVEPSSAKASDGKANLASVVPQKDNADSYSSPENTKVELGDSSPEKEAEPGVFSSTVEKVALADKDEVRDEKTETDTGLSKIVELAASTKDSLVSSLFGSPRAKPTSKQETETQTPDDATKVVSVKVYQTPTIAAPSPSTQVSPQVDTASSAIMKQPGTPVTVQNSDTTESVDKETNTPPAFSGKKVELAAAAGPEKSTETTTAASGGAAIASAVAAGSAVTAGAGPPDSKLGIPSVNKVESTAVPKQEVEPSEQKDPTILPSTGIEAGRLTTDGKTFSSGNEKEKMELTSADTSSVKFLNSKDDEGLENDAKLLGHGGAAHAATLQASNFLEALKAKIPHPPETPALSSVIASVTSNGQSPPSADLDVDEEPTVRKEAASVEEPERDWLVSASSPEASSESDSSSDLAPSESAPVRKRKKSFIVAGASFMDSLLEKIAENGPLEDSEFAEKEADRKLDVSLIKPQDDKTSQPEGPKQLSSQVFGIISEGESTDKSSTIGKDPAASAP